MRSHPAWLIAAREFRTYAATTSFCVALAIGPGITKKDCAAVVDAFLNAVRETLANHDHIEIRGFGTFKVRHRKARVARNPRTGEPVHIPASKAVKFSVAADFKKQVNS